MALTKIFVALLLVGIMSGTLAAPDQTAELEKSNEYGDTQDAKDNIAQDFAAPDEIEAVERPDRPVELEEDDENGNVQHSSAYCLRIYRLCRERGYGIPACIEVYRRCRARRVNQEDEDRPVELEDDTENGNTQDIKDNIPHDFAATDRIEAVERPYRPIELEEVDENGNVQNGKAHCRRIYRSYRGHGCRRRVCRRVYRRCRARSVSQDDEGYSHE